MVSVRKRAVHRRVGQATPRLSAFALLVVAPAALAQGFIPGDLIVSTSIYQGTASTITIGQSLPGGGNAVANGAFEQVFNNATPDPSFGITSPIILQQLTPSGSLVSSMNITDMVSKLFNSPTTNFVTSFSSKSELALNLSTNGSSLTFMGYAAPVNTLDVSNSNTPGIIEPGNFTQNTSYRVVAQLNAGGSLQLTTTNAYNGNNPRASILVNNLNEYLAVGNAGNGNGSAQTTAANGVQLITPGVNATPNTPGTIKVGGFDVHQINPATGQPYSTSNKDKQSKDDNYRGETIYNNTLYVTKGSGSNGINTVYQVGNAGQLPTAADAATTTINVLPGFPTDLARGSNPHHPFGIWFGNADTLYVADEGNQQLSDTAATNTYAGLEKWSRVNGIWQLDYTLTNGLRLDLPYLSTDPGYIPGINNGTDGTGTAWNPETDGLRNITGKVNGDGTVTLYAVTSTVSGSGDQGGDPNKLVEITDTLVDTTAAQAGTEAFTVLESATPGEVIRGVGLAPVPEPGTLALLLASSITGPGLTRAALRDRKRARLSKAASSL